MEGKAGLGKKPRRKYTDRFKAELVALYMQGGESLTSIAVNNGMNPNVLHRWVHEYERFGRHDLSLFEGNNYLVNTDSPSNLKPGGANNWFALIPQQENTSAIPKAVTTTNKTVLERQSDSIALEISSDQLKLNLSWPGADHSGLARFIKELMA